jgi:hypothetical protein
VGNLRGRRSAALPVIGLFLACLGAGSLVAACSSGDDAESGDDANLTEFPEGAMLKVSIDGAVGVLLDDLKALPDAEGSAIKANLQKQTPDFWKERARMQIRLTNQRQYFRQYYHGDPGSGFDQEKTKIAEPGKGQLPLPPMVDPTGADIWSKDITLSGSPTVEQVDGHQVLVQKYKYAGTVITDKDSPGKSDKLLANVGGKVQEDYVLPVDPDYLRQRTGLACLTESEFPPNSVDNENAWRFFEQSCKKGTKNDCHTEDEIRLGQVTEDCGQAIKGHIGTSKMAVRFERVAYDRATADKVRVGTMTTPAGMRGADMSVRKDDLEINRLVWRYVSGASCEVEESDMADNHKSSCVVRPEQIKADGGGWRHVLEFNATGYNVGNYPVHIGNVNYFVENGVQTQVEDHGIFEKSTCHKHYHFKHYGDFLLSGTSAINKKNGFCLESTTRYSNNEISPIFTQYGRCINQGVEIGWGDEYEAGLTCQWLDVTDTNPGKAKIGFFSNPDGFLCEGVPDGAAPLTPDGFPTVDTKITKWEKTDFKTDTGKPVDKPACKFTTDKWKSNNKEEADVDISKTGGLVSQACRLDGEPHGKHYAMGPERDCGFKNTGTAADSFVECTAGQQVTLSCEAQGDKTQVLRVCEASHTVGGAIDCMLSAPGAARVASDSLASGVVSPGKATTVTFTCPAARDKKETGGRYSLYGGSYIASDAPQAIKCTPQ